MTQETDWSEYVALNERSKGVRRPEEFKFVRQVKKADWMRLSRQEKRKLFRDFSVHVMEDGSGGRQPMTSLAADEMHSLLDIYEARFCHGEHTHICSERCLKEEIRRFILPVSTGQPKPEAFSGNY